MGKFIYLMVSLCALKLASGDGINDFANADAFIQSLLSNSLGKSNTAYKTLSRIQNGAFELLSGINPRLNDAKREQFLKMLNAAAKAKNTEKVHELIGKLLYTIQAITSPAELSRIISKYAGLLSDSTGSSRKRRSVDPFDQIFNHLYVLDGGATLVFAIDDTGSMHENMVEAVNISTEIVNMERLGGVDYILSPFNDPTTGPITVRSSSEKSQFITDLQALTPHDGGDCPELAFKGMEDALNSYPQYGSSMFVFTDAAPKDADDFNVQNIIDTANHWYDMKISFFLDESMCGSTTEIDKFRKVAAETGGEVFTMDIPDAKKRRRRRRRSTSGSDYTAFVSSSLRGTSLVTAGTSSTSSIGGSARKRVFPVLRGKSYIKIHTFDIDEAISYVYLVITVDGTTAGISLSDPKGTAVSRSSTTKDAVIFEVENPTTGKWTLSINAESGSYNFKVSVAFKEPIDFDVKYFYQERPNKFTLIKRPLIDERQQILISVVGGDKIDASSIKAWFVDLAGNQIGTLSLTNVGSEDSLKFTASFVPPKAKTFRIKLAGKTRRGLNFERTTEQATTTAQVVFKTMFAGDEFSAKIGSAAVRIMNVLFIKKGNEETVKITAKAKYGTVTPAEQTKGVRARGFFFLQYKPPTNSALAGLSDYVTIQASYRPGEITTHRISILLLS